MFFYTLVNLPFVFITENDFRKQLNVLGYCQSEEYSFHFWMTEQTRIFFLSEPKNSLLMLAHDLSQPLYNSFIFLFLFGQSDSMSSSHPLFIFEFNF